LLSRTPLEAAFPSLLRPRTGCSFFFFPSFPDPLPIFDENSVFLSCYRPIDFMLHLSASKPFRTRSRTACSSPFSVAGLGVRTFPSIPHLGSASHLAEARLTKSAVRFLANFFSPPPSHHFLVSPRRHNLLDALLSILVMLSSTYYLTFCPFEPFDSGNFFSFPPFLFLIFFRILEKGRLFSSDRDRLHPAMLSFILSSSPYQEE